MSDAQSLLSLPVAAARLGVCTKTLKRWNAAEPRKASLVKLPNGHYRITAAELDRLVSEGHAA